MPSDTPRDPFDLIGTTIEGKYRVASVVGDGGFGVVYRGVHTGFGELIAIKCLKIPNNLEEKQRDALLEQLKEEGRLLHKLSKATPGIVQALDVGAMTTAAGVWVPYLVLEWLDGETLGELQRRREIEGLGGMPLHEAIELLTPAARALAVAHQNKIAHRDVKPANLFVTKVGERRTLKVLDFGIAKVLTDTTMTEALAVTRQGPSAFTPRYGAPEQFNKQRGATGPWTDVFALALILVELTTGKRALDGDDPTQLYVAAADPTLRPTFRGRGLDVSDPVEAVMAKALHVEPKYRYSDAGELWDALLGAAGMPIDGLRTSSPSVTSGRGAADSGKGRTSAPTKNPDSDNLATAEFAAQEALPLERGPMSGPAEPHAQTKPLESLKKDTPPAVVVSKGSAGPSGTSVMQTSVTSASAHVATEAKEPPVHVSVASPSKVRVPDDPMAETPLLARVPRIVANETLQSPSPAAGGDLRTTTPSSREVPSSAPASEANGKGGRGLWIALAGIVGVAGVTAFLYFTRPGANVDGGSGAKGSASALSSLKPPSSGKPNASGTPSASATASSSASSTASATATVDAGAPPAPPEDMVYIAPLSAKLGEGPTARDVTLTKGFYLEKREVTSKAYAACVTSGVCTAATEPKSSLRFSGDPDAGDGPNEAAKQAEDMWRGRCTAGDKAQPDHPINCVTYPQAERYCTWKKRRLPTEAEWEAAAQGADQRAYPWGNARPDCERSCIDKNSSDCRGGDVATCAAGSHSGDKTPTEVLDLGGNVAEWVVDGFAPKPLAGTDPKANIWAKTHVVRGGSFFDSLDLLRSSTRREMHGSAAEAWVGVRCAMDVPASP